MKKNRNILNNIILVFIIFIAIGAVILPKPLNNLDELWNFNFALNVSEGRIPYRDFNIVSTPLLSMVCGNILKIVGQELIVTRILAIAISTAIMFIVYKILQELKINKYYTYIILGIIYEIYKQFFCLDYNFSVLLIVLIIIYLEIRRVNNTRNNIVNLNFKYDFFVGILAGTTILFKQSTGIALAFIYIFYKLILVENKEDFKRWIKITFSRLLGSCVPIILFIIYLLINNAWENFLDYAVYGIKTFSNKLSYVNLLKYYGKHYNILSILLPLTIIYAYFKSAIKEQKKKEDMYATILCAFCVASFVVVFPISDPMHLLVGALPAIILLVFLTYKPIKQLLQKKKLFIIEFMKILTKFIAILTVIMCINPIYSYLTNCNKYKILKHFYYIPADATKKNNCK